MVPIPLNDHIRRQIFWLSTLALIAANVLAFLFELTRGRELDRLVLLLGIIPARYTTPRSVASLTPEGLLLSLFGSMFLHGGWLHLAGNMLFLFVFGRSVEDRFGHLKFLAVYFLAGVAGTFLHVLFNPGSRVPSIGASGAIAGILGAYFICFPGARITTLVPLFFFFWTLELPAVLLLGYWFLIQFFAGFQMLAIQSATGGGVAWWAHVGAFIVGMALAMMMRPRRRRPVIEWIAW